MPQAVLHDYVFRLGNAPSHGSFDPVLNVTQMVTDTESNLKPKVVIKLDDTQSTLTYLQTTLNRYLLDQSNFSKHTMGTKFRDGFDTPAQKNGDEQIISR